MATLLWQRDIGSDINGVKNTYSSWDSCMTKAYCKWVAIVGIILACLVVLSLVWCVARCLCCGAECCCGCLACCNACCPSPRGSKKSQGYQQAPFNNQYHPPPVPQYQSQAPPIYASGQLGYRNAPPSVAQTAIFDTPHRNTGRFNEDALPAMPSWENAPSRREEVHDEVEMEHMSQQDNLLPDSRTGRFYGGGERSATQSLAHNGDIGSMPANPYHDHQRHQELVPSPYGSQHGARSPYSPQPTGYGGANADYYGASQPQQRGYEPSIPPSYHTRPPSDTVSPVSPPGGSLPQYPGQQAYQAYQAYGGAARKPVQGSWREI